MRILKYAMLQTRVDGEAVQQPALLEGGRSLGSRLGVGATGGQTQVQVQVQAHTQAQVQVQVRCRKCACIRRWAPGGCIR